MESIFTVLLIELFKIIDEVYQKIKEQLLYPESELCLLIVIAITRSRAFHAFIHFANVILKLLEHELHLRLRLLW